MANPDYALTPAEKSILLDHVKRRGLGPAARALGVPRETLASVCIDSARKGSVVLVRSLLPRLTEPQTAA